MRKIDVSEEYTKWMTLVLGTHEGGDAGGLDGDEADCEYFGEHDSGDNSFTWVGGVPG